jgi:hypothetical protein
MSTHSNAKLDCGATAATPLCAAGGNRYTGDQLNTRNE